MLCFPQLSTGVMAQYPIVKRVARRVVSNALLDGGLLKAADPGAYRSAWELRYSGLSDAERVLLENFYQSAEGRLRSFLFLDPTGNLLRWSVDLAKDVWRRDALIQITGPQVVNTGQVAQGFEQIVGVPGALHYAWSVYARADVPSQVVLSMGACSATLEVAPRWQRLVCTGVPGGDDDVRCRLQIPAGAVVEVRDLQLEPQRFPSGYHATAQSSGVHAGTRFDQDRLLFTANGIDDHSVNIRLVSKAGA